MDNTLFRMAFYITIIFILFNLGWGFVRGLDNTIYTEGQDLNNIEGETDTGVFTELTGLTGAGVGIWAVLTGVGTLASVAFSWMVQSLQPLALYIFTVGFWTSYNGTMSAIHLNNWLPDDFILIITVAIIFLFIGAVIGLITGNG